MPALRTPGERSAGLPELPAATDIVEVDVPAAVATTR